MTSKFRLILCVIFALFISSLSAKEISIIPLPAKMELKSGEFTLEAKTKVYIADKNGAFEKVYKRWESKFENSTQIELQQTRNEKRASVAIIQNPKLKAEAYHLSVKAEGIRIEASDAAGLYYALLSLEQLSCVELLAGVKVKNWDRSFPCVEIEDTPRFGWRGFMLDEGRHFYGKDEVKKIIDAMARYKMNRFHWHLTEDQGWRIEIKKYPKLTDVGAWRESRVLAYGEVKPDGKRYGGFYTQEDIKEVVAYAKERFIEIIPEIDIPGHSQAAVASYPEFLACDPEKKHEVWLWQGISTDVINVANPKAVEFAKDVIDELTELFPFGYIHLGGDECPVNKWQKNKECQELLQKIGSENYRDLQIHFYKQLKDHIAQKPADKQRKLIFWNEVLHGNTKPLGEDITIMAWIGADQAALSAAKRGMNTILTPQIPYYINRRQSKLETEPRSQGWGTETVEAVYNYIPMKGAETTELQNRYMGVQANFWTEWVEEASIVQYLMFPRLAAVAEAGWTPQEKRKYEDFLQRLQAESEYYRLKGLNYGKHVIQ
ncbi:MAG: beta-N-acetylhexosaminidase [Alistipes sp.]|nr:beta-N-acetylhexosaminidase [Alistipes sp.]MBQ5786355.1 beta-N-acetylhexosaminidase [Alistipes sp.]MBQ5914652.1 beta-N-acetylhexosaminidase [Alistipes sp.]